MIKSLQAFFALFLFATSLTARTPDTLWTRVYGGSGADVAYSVIETSDGYYLAAGYTGFGAGLQDCWLMKLDKSGDTLWTKTFGGTAEDGAHKVAEAHDGGYIVVGYTESSGSGGKDAYIVKTDRNGATKWTKTYGTALQEALYGIAPTTGGYVVCGYRNGPSGWTKGDLWIIKIDESGDTLWTKTYGGPGEESGTAIQKLDDGFILSGSTASFGAGGKDAWLVRIDEYGDTLWTRTYGQSLEDVAYGLNVTNTEGFVMTGYIDGTGAWTAGDLWIIETDKDGNTFSTKRYGSAGEDFGFDICQTTDGGYVTGGERALNAGDMWILKTDKDADTVWGWICGMPAMQSSLSLFPASDGGYIAAGFAMQGAAPDFYIVKTRPALSLVSPNGSEELASGAPYPIRWHVENSSKPPHTFRLLCSEDAGTSFPDTIVSGINPADSSYTWTVSLNQGSSFRIRIELLDESNEVLAADESDDNFIIGTGIEEPVTPTTPSLLLDVADPSSIRYSLPSGERGTITLYDPSGRRIESYRVQGEGQVAMKSSLSSGVYFVKLETGKVSIARKAVVLN